MRKKSEKKLKINYKKFSLFLLVSAFLIYSVITISSQFFKLNKYKEISNEYKEQISEAREENQRLTEEYSQVGTDEYLQNVAREELGLIKADERVFVDLTK